MITVELEVLKRESLGKEANKKYRDQGLVPAVVYGKNKENLNILVDPKTLKKILRRDSGENTILEISVTESDVKKNVLLKDAHIDTLTSNPLHLDFYEITEGELVKVPCPINFVGKHEGVKSGGVIQKLSEEVKVQCLPDKIPNNIEVDISSLNIGDTLRIEDLKKIDGIDFLSNPKSTLISILAPRVVVETTTEDEESSAEGESDNAGTGETENSES